MRVDKEGYYRTLEEDIQEIWKLHGLEVIEEQCTGYTWLIKAKKIKQETKKKDG